MSAKEKSDQIHSIVTTGGTDGGCSAACLLMAYGENCPVHISSQNLVHHALQKQLHLEPRPSVIHVCGVGISDNLPMIVEQLRELGKEGVQVLWYCGRGYLKPYEKELGRVCKLVFDDDKTNTEVVAKHNHVVGKEQVGLLAELAREYVNKKKPSKDHQVYHSMLELSSNRFFQFGDEEHFLRVLRKIAGLLPISEKDRQEVEQFVKEPRRRRAPLGTSKAMDQLRAQVKKIAALDEPVLILGPSGAGKELVARALHDGSSRKDAPFMPINCAILSTSVDLAYDRLFGHVPEAYTGAHKGAIGAFEKAAGGTLFLDEVAELPSEIQTQLLRVLEEKTIMPHGNSDERQVDVRIIAATNRDISGMVRQGKFRQDLYYRMNMFTIEVPPLRERLEDMKSIASGVQKELQDKGVTFKLTQQDWKVLEGYHWPGNVRQFRSVVTRAALSGITIAESVAQERRLAAEVDGESSQVSDQARMFLPQTPEEVRPEEEVRRRYLRHVYELFGGSYKKAAKALGMAENTLRTWLNDDDESNSSKE